MEDKFTRLQAAVKALYSAAHWTADRPVDDIGLWTELRDAAEIAPGNSPKPAEKCVLCEKGRAVEVETLEYGRHFKCENGCEEYYTGEQATAFDYERKVKKLTIQKDGAYSERNQLVAALGKLAIRVGGTCTASRHDASDHTWDDDWRNIITITLPETGQMSWHIHDSEVNLFSDFTGLDFTPWDGHTTEEKYERLKNLRANMTEKRSTYAEGFTAGLVALRASGLEPSDFAKSLAKKVEAGEITLEEMEKLLKNLSAKG